MGVRDFEHWTAEATRSVLTRRRELCEAALLPHMRQEAINRHLDELRFALYELDHGEEIEEIETMAHDRLLKIRADLKAKRERLKKEGEGKGRKK